MHHRETFLLQSNNFVTLVLYIEERDITGECAKIRHILNNAISEAIFFETTIPTTPPLNARKGADLPRLEIFF